MRVLVIGLLCAIGACGAAQQPTSDPRIARASCQVLRRSTNVLRDDDGRRVYVEPQTVSRSGKLTLALGRILNIDARRGGAVAGSETAVGVIVDDSGRAVRVAAPVPKGTMMWVPRAVARGRSEWEVVWMQYDTTMDRADGPAALYSARLGVAGWSKATQLRNVERTLFGDGLMSELVRSPQGAAFALPVSVDGVRKVHFVAQIGGRWETQLISESRGVLYVTLEYSDSAWILAYVGTDTVGVSGLFVTRSDDSGRHWDRPRRIAVGNTFAPALARVEGRDVLFWLPEQQPGVARGLRGAASIDTGKHWKELGTDGAFDAVDQLGTARLADGSLLVAANVNGANRHQRLWGLFTSDTLLLIGDDAVYATTAPWLLADGKRASLISGQIVRFPRDTVLSTGVETREVLCYR